MINITEGNTEHNILKEIMEQIKWREIKWQILNKQLNG